MAVSYKGDPPVYQASRRFVTYGPMIVKVCATKTGARFAAWRLRRREASSSSTEGRRA